MQRNIPVPVPAFTPDEAAWFRFRITSVCGGGK